MKILAKHLLFVFGLITVCTACSEDDMGKAEAGETPFIEVETISINESNFEVQVGETEQLGVTILPSNASEISITWTSDDIAVIEVDDEGNLNAKRPGTAVITATTTNNISDSCAVNVLVPGPTGSWTERASFGNGIGRYGAASFVIGTKIYVATGSDYIYSFEAGGGSNVSSGDHFKNDFWMYDTELDTWTQLDDFPGIPRSYGVGFAVNDKGYFGLGQFEWNNPEGSLNDIWEYDPGTDIWTQLSDFPGGARSSATGFESNGMAYVGMGGDLKSDIWQYDPVADSWIQLPDFPGGGRTGVVGFGINNDIYVGMGSHSTDPFALQDFDLWQYNTITETWTQKADLKEGVWDMFYNNFGRVSAASFSMGSKGYVGMGYAKGDWGYERKDFWEYDPVADYWRPLTEVPYSGRSVLAFAVNSRIFIGAGLDDWICGNHCEERYALTRFYEFLP